MKPTQILEKLSQLITWKLCLLLSYVFIPAVAILNFYGLYTNKFYLLKPDNFILPLLCILHLVYLYAIRFKIKESDFPDAKMRNLEYIMYGVSLIYIFKMLDTLYILMSYNDYKDYILPGVFLPMGFLILGSYLILILLTLLSFRHRKLEVGPYNFDQVSENMDSWS